MANAESGALPPDMEPIFELEALCTVEGMERAARYIENEPRKLRELARAPHKLGLVLSEKYERLRPLLEREVLDKLPTDRDMYLPSDPQAYLVSISADVLPALAKYLSTLAPPSDISATNYKKYNFSTPRVNIALEAVVQIAKQDRASETFSWDAARKACDELEIGYPELEEEAEELLIDLIEALRTYAEFYIWTVLANRNMARRIRDTIFLVVEAPDPTDAALPRPPSHPAPARDSSAESGHEVEDEPERVFATVKPERAHQYFDNTPEDFGQWRIFISSACVAHLRTFLRRDKHTFSIIQKKIIELSNGFFSDSNHKRLSGGRDDIAILEAKMTGDLRLVYRIDLWTDDDLKLDQQCILLYGVFTHAQFDHRLWDRVGRAIPQRNKEYTKRCNFRNEPRRQGVNVTDPHSWEHDDAVTAIAPTRDTGFSEEEYLQLHKMLSLEKFILVSTAVIKSIMDDKDFSYMFKVSPTETKVIHYDSSCFVIGRSGTGKTTTMLFKLLGIEKTKGLANQPVRQIFLTQSHILAQRVQEYYTSLYGAVMFGAGNVQQSAVDTMGLFRLDEEADIRSDLPPRYSELKEHHFPLFVTYDQIRRMLENDLNLDFTRHKTTKRSAATAGKIQSSQGPVGGLLGINDLVEAEDETPVGPVDSVAPTSSHLVTFDSFVNEYWPHLDQRLTGKLEPALVYSELMGVICGNEGTLNTPEGHLDREAYLALSHRAFSTFSDDRPRIYDLFEKYKTLKLRNAAYDTTDRTHAILRNMTDQLPKIDYLYVDECQDFLIVDVKLLRKLCDNAKGLFWGGDTAQTISLGSTFRFADLGSLLHKDELEEPSVVRGLREAVKPAVFELLVNYRSHGGIVECASSIIQLIWTLFPNSIDKLQPETAVVTGPKPCIFRGWDSDAIHFEQFLFGGESQRGDFGARQVILVRSDEAREELRAQLGNSGLILTLLESKGLEFDDVLMYGFFERSPASYNQWRVVLNALEGTSNEPRPKRDELKHAIINTELKNLYVGITRARHHCWIWDSSPQAEPIVKYWQSRNLIRVQGPGDPIPQLATSSTPEEWISTARDLFQKKLYAQAAACFEKAGRLDQRDIAIAFHKRKEAQRIAATTPRRAAYKAAGEAFTACGDASPVGDEGYRTYHKLAMGCFEEAHEHQLAVSAQAKSLDETAAASLLAKEGNYHDAMILIKPPKGKGLSRVSREVAEKITEEARLAWLTDGRYEDAATLFDNIEDEVDFARQRGLRAAHKHVLRESNQFAAAADLYSIDGEFKEAAQTYLASRLPNSRRKAADALIDGLWTQCFSQDMLSNAKKLLADLMAFNRDPFKPIVKDQIKMFSAISKQEADILIELGESYATRDVAICVLSYDRSFKYPPKLYLSSHAQMLSKLTHIAVFVGSVTSLLDGRPRDSVVLSRLTGFRQATDLMTTEELQGRYKVFTGSALAKRLVASKVQDLHVVTLDGGILVHGHDLDKALRLILENRVRIILINVHENLLQARLRPCLDLSIGKDGCKKDGGKDGDGEVKCEYDHTENTIATARIRLYVHLQAVLVLHKMQSITWPDDKATWPRDTRRVWIQRVHILLYPIWYPFGNDQIVSLKSSHRALDGSKPFYAWLQEYTEDLDPLANDSDTSVSFLPDAIAVTMLAFRWPHRTRTDFLRLSIQSYASHAGLTDERIHVVTKAIEFYERSSVDSLTSGIEAFRQVISKELRMDVNVLLHFIEHVILDVIMNERGERKQPFHDLLLPRSWILHAVRHRATNAEKPTLASITGPIQDLLAQLFHWDGSANNNVYDGNTSPKGWAPKNALICRACQSLVFLGYNTWRTTSDRKKILDVLASIPKTAENLAQWPLIQGFIKAQSWEQTLLALYESMPPKENDQLILLEDSKQATQHDIPFVLRVTWDNIIDIEPKLSYDQEKPLPAPKRSSPSSSSRSQAATSSTPSAAAPTTSAKHKKKKKKKAKSANNAQDDQDTQDDSVPALEPITPKFPSTSNKSTPSKSTASNATSAKAAAPNITRAQAEAFKRQDSPSDSDDEPPPLISSGKVTASQKTQKAKPAKPAKSLKPGKSAKAAVPEEEDDDDSMPPLIPAERKNTKTSKQPFGGSGNMGGIIPIVQSFLSGQGYTGQPEGDSDEAEEDVWVDDDESAGSGSPPPLEQFGVKGKAKSSSTKAPPRFEEVLDENSDASADSDDLPPLEPLQRPKPPASTAKPKPTAKSAPAPKAGPSTKPTTAAKPSAQAKPTDASKLSFGEKFKRGFSKAIAVEPEAKRSPAPVARGDSLLASESESDSDSEGPPALEPIKKPSTSTSSAKSKPNAKAAPKKAPSPPPEPPSDDDDDDDSDGPPPLVTLRT